MKLDICIGNPGLIKFYTEFLTLLHGKHPRLAIFGHAHLGHTPNVPSRAYSLRAQIEVGRGRHPNYQPELAKERH
jgi:hypothetical protein